MKYTEKNEYMITIFGGSNVHTILVQKKTCLGNLNRPELKVRMRSTFFF